MKKLVLLFLGVATLATSGFSQGWCGTDVKLEQYFQLNPEERARFNQWQDDLTNGVLTKGRKNSKSATYTIPVVVHVIHYNGDGNISREQIEDGIRVLNEDFQKLNADTADTRNLFKSVAADVDIQFKLANKAPDSSCTTGIVRVNSYSTYDFDDDDKSISHWNSNNYFNVWLVDDISEGGGTGNILGYAQFPFAFGGGTFNLNTYGIVVLNEEWGTIGTAVNASIPEGRTATHEVGHCLNLLHTFQSGCGFDCRNSGDRVCDTPPAAAAANFNCDTLSNTCSNDNRGGSTTNINPYTTNVVDQVENYMGYDNCQTLFTEGQKDRMYDAIAVASHLVNLVSASNLRATGTNDGYIAQLCPPVAEMYLSEQLICKGDSVTFSDDSYGDTIVSYKWIFPGGTPDTSALANPTVTYDSSGIFDVILTVTNTAGTDTLVVSNAVNVTDSSQAVAAFNYSESFEGATTIGNEWRIEDPSGNQRWSRVRRAFVGSYSAFLSNFNNEKGERDILISPLFDMTTVVNPQIKFRVANKSIAGASQDALLCEVSTDCGKTWSLARGLTTRNISSGNQSNSYFPAGTADWKEFTINLSAAQASSPELRFRFNFTSGGGNNIYLDDFRITGTSSTVGLQSIADNKDLEMSIYPNPTQKERTNIGIFLAENSVNSSIYLTDIMGKRVLNLYQGKLSAKEYWFTIESSQLSPGIYFVTLEKDQGRLTKKLVVR